MRWSAWRLSTGKGCHALVGVAVEHGQGLRALVGVAVEHGQGLSCAHGRPPPFPTCRASGAAPLLAAAA
eukprot:352953-Chlamydomonas_euryale.AAC.7